MSTGTKSRIKRVVNYPNKNSNQPLVTVVIPTYNRKEKLSRLIHSILESNYPKDRIEVIAVDDVSTDGTLTYIKRRFPRVKIIANERKISLAGSRNKGMRISEGKYIFLIDDDNIVDKKCISELVRIMENDRSCSMGIIAPITYYQKQPIRILISGVKINMLTSLTTLMGKDQIDKGQFNNLIESENAPNAFMIRREIIDEVGLLDEKTFPIHYDEADYGERVRKKGYKILYAPKARVWHDSPLPEEVKNKAEFFHCQNETRAYYVAKNRIIFHKKYSNWWQFLIFILFFNWLFAIFYVGIILLGSQSPKERLKIAEFYLKGIADGIRWK